MLLHSRYQSQRLIELKKFIQISSIVERLQTSYKEHLHLVYKLYENVNELRKDFSNKYLNQGKIEVTSKLDIKILDDLFYALLTNKQKFAQLLGVTMHISMNVTANNKSITLKKVQHLSILMDELILLLFDSKMEQSKEISFHYSASPTSIYYEFSNREQI